MWEPLIPDLICWMEVLIVDPKVVSVLPKRIVPQMAGYALRITGLTARAPDQLQNAKLEWKRIVRQDLKNSQRG